MTHLTDEELDLLLAHPDPAHPHLLACAPCREELAALGGSLTALRDALTALASSTPIPLPQPRPTRARAWVLATACLALTAAAALPALPALHHSHPAEPLTQAASQTNQDDEALLEGIHQDLSTRVPPSLTPLSTSLTNSELKAQN